MPNVSEKKRKLLVLLKLLLEKTDETHSLTLPQILRELEAQGITAERKSIYDDIETLRSFGVEVQKRKTRTFEYFIAERRFTLQELKLLADAAQVSGFFSRKKAAELTGRLGTLCSAYQAGELSREIDVPGWNRGLSDKTLAVLDLLHSAMSQDRQIRFLPASWRLSGAGKPERVVRKGGRAVVVSPWKLIWSEGRYELLAYEAEHGRARRCRLEEMAALELLSTSREGKDSALALEYSEKNGDEEKLTLEFAPGLLEEIVERFGMDITVEPSGKSKMRVTVRTALGPDFFSWLFSLGTEAKLLSPKRIAEQFRERAKAAAKLYKS